MPIGSRKRRIEDSGRNTELAESGQSAVPWTCRRISNVRWVRPVQMRLVQIADRRGVDVGLPHEFVEARRALSPESDKTDLNLVACRRACVCARGRAESDYESSSVH
jgi:hypothetical protein